MGLPLSSVKSVSGTANQVAASPPDAFLQSRQWQVAMKSGSASNSNVTAPHAHRPECFLGMCHSSAGAEDRVVFRGTNVHVVGVTRRQLLVGRRHLLAVPAVSRLRTKGAYADLSVRF